MKKMNRKGFTIVELVIVIAVIAILAGVLIPTFSGIVEKAQKSAALQEARNAYTEMYADDIADGVIDGKTLKNQNAAVTAESGLTIEGYGKGKITGYTQSGGAVATFAYTASNGKTVSFDGTTWTY